MTDVQQARIEAAARAIRDIHYPDDAGGDPGEGWLGMARAALEAADAVVTVEDIARVIDKADRSTPTGSRPHRHRVIAEAIQSLYRGEEQSNICDCPVTGLTIVDGCEHEQRRQGA